MAILFGTTGDGTTLPVLVDQFGNLLAKGIPGDEGPPGPPGGAFALPPDPVDGDVLGWENGQLVWVSEPIPPVNPSIFTPVIYSGNSGTQSITGVGFSPDLVWIKDRTSSSVHYLTDTVRGATKYLDSASTNEERIDNQSLISFDSDGFTLGSTGGINGTGYDYVAWCWEASDTTVTNNDGTIESQVRSNGNFSVVKYTGNQDPSDSFGHGLSDVPSFVLIKRLNDTFSWRVYHKSLPTHGFLVLNENTGVDVNSNNFPSAPTDTVIYVGVGTGVNTNADDYIAYCWAETPGESSFSEYTGNGSTTGPVIDCGFEPSFVMIKSTSNGDWYVMDAARGANKILYPNLSNAESTESNIEFTDIGFNIITSAANLNSSSQNYIYAAFR